MDTEESTTVVAEITINAPMERVFAAISEPDEIVQWWGSADTYQCTNMEQDFRVGGAWRTTGVNADGKPFSVRGVYRSIDPPRRIEFTWHYDWGDGVESAESTVRYDLETRAGGTRLRVTHWGLTNPEERAGHADGWLRVFGWLRAYVEVRSEQT